MLNKRMSELKNISIIFTYSTMLEKTHLSIEIASQEYPDVEKFKNGNTIHKDIYALLPELPPSSYVTSQQNE